MTPERLAQIQAMADWSWKGVVRELLVEVDRLRAELAEVKAANYERYVAGVTTSAVMRKALGDKLTFLRAALKRYGRHETGVTGAKCKLVGWRGPPPKGTPCTCGLDAALAANPAAQTASHLLNDKPTEMP